MLLPALSPAPGLPVPRARLLGAGREHGQGLPRSPHGVLGQHHGPEGGQSQPIVILSFLLNTVSDIIPLSKGFIFFLFPSGKLEFSLKEN